MLISKGKVPAKEPWRILEVAIGQAPDVMAIRLKKELRTIHEKAMQLLIPMRRNSAGEAEWIIEHVYVRGANGSLGKLAKTAGIDFIRIETADEWWIEQLMKQEAKQESAKLKLNQFVRVLTGPCARMCGHITAMQPKRIVVTIQMYSKKVKVYTSAPNIQPIDCPPEQQTFFYRPELLS